MTQNSNGLSSTVANYSDQKIISILKAPKDFSKLIVDACLVEAKSRNIYKSKEYNESQLPRHNINFLHITQVRELLNQGKLVEECEKFLLNKGLDIDYVTKTIEKAKIPQPKHVPGKYANKDHYGLRIGTVFFLVYLTFKIISYYL